MESTSQACVFIGNLLSAASINNVILLCGVVATVLAIRSAKKATVSTLKQNREIAKQTQTALLMFNARADRSLIDGYTTIRVISASHDDNIAAYATNTEKRATDNAERIRYVLNFWERTAVCVRHEIYCESILKESMYTTVTDAFQRSQPYIQAVREQKHSQTPYKDFEALALRWKADPLKA